MILCEIAGKTVMTTITTPTSHTGGLVQLEIPQQWAAIPPILAAGGRRRPAARAPPGAKPEKQLVMMMVDYGLDRSTRSGIP